MSSEAMETPLISETLLKRRRSLEELSFRRSLMVSEISKSKGRRKVRGDSTKVKRPEQFVKEFLIKDSSDKRLKRKLRQAERKSSKKIVRDMKRTTVGFVIRVNEGRHLSQSIKSQLREFSLDQKYDAQFIVLNEETLRRLQPLDDYIAYGYISKRSVEELVHRRAFTVAKGSRQPLSDNITVEALLGEKGILCLSDLSDEIYSVGPNFEEALSIFCPFKLSSPLGAYESKVLKNSDELEKGGFLSDAMDTFLEKIL